MQRRRDIPIYDSYTFDPYPLADSHNKNEKQVLQAIQQLHLDLNVYSGQGRGSTWDKTYENKVPFTESIVRIRSESLKIQIDIAFVMDDGRKAAIHTKMLTVDRDHQGSFWKLNRFMQDIKMLLLERMEYPFLYGRAIVGDNTQSRFSKDDDFRCKTYRAGNDKNGRPIYMPGIKLLYLRMGFVPFYQVTGCEDEVAMLSERKIKESQKVLGEAFHEWTAFDRSSDFQKRSRKSVNLHCG